MKPLLALPTLAALLAWTIPTSLSAADFDNWFFDFFTGSSKSTEEHFDAKGKKVDQGEGSLNGAISEDGSSFVLRVDYKSQKQGTSKATLTWKKVVAGNYRGEYRNSNGADATYSLTLQDNKAFEMSARGAEGVTIVSVGRLEEDGKIRSQEKVQTRDGKLIVRAESQTEKEEPLADSNLRVLAYNVWYGFTKVPDRKPLWLEWMKAQEADVVLLQELNQYTPEKLSEDAKSWNHPHTVLLKEKGFPTGITSRYPLEDVQKTLEGFHHGLIRAKIQGIYYYCIHLHPSNWEVRTREIKLIVKDIKRLPEGADIILAGDFNTFSPHDKEFYSHGLLEPFFAKLDERDKALNLRNGQLDYSVLQTLMDAGFTDLEALLRTEDYTFTGSFPTLIEKQGEHGDLRRLDYVFTNSKLTRQVRRASVVADKTTQILSDHLPVIVDFQRD